MFVFLHKMASLGDGPGEGGGLHNSERAAIEFSKF